MSTPRLAAALATALLTCGLAAASAHADTNLLVNGTFETPQTTPPTVTFTSGAPDGYTSTNNGFGGVGVQNSATNGITTADPDGGTQDLYENLNTSGNVMRPTTVTVTQTLDGATYGSLTTNAVTLAPSTVYVYSGYLIGRNDGTALGDVTFNLLAGGTVLGSETFSTAEGNNVAPGAVDPFSITVNSGDFTGEIGQTLSVNAVATGDGGSELQQVNIDALSLTASAAPEPSQVGMLALMGLGLGSLLLRARRRA